jgi:hypothetical protein
MQLILIFRATCPTTPVGGPPSYKTNQVSTPGTQQGGGELPIPSVGSPPSAAPSPLLNPPSQPTSVTATGKWKNKVCIGICGKEVKKC